MKRSFGTCIVDSNGNTFCWDIDRNQLVLIVEKDIPLEEAPIEIIRALIEMGFNK